MAAKNSPGTKELTSCAKARTGFQRLVALLKSGPSRNLHEPYFSSQPL
jgi:hypothetical protein